MECTHVLIKDKLKTTKLTVRDANSKNFLETSVASFRA